MQTLTIQTDSADFIAKAKEILTTLAKFDGVRIGFDDEALLKADYEQRADNALKGIGLIDEAQALELAKSIKAGTFRHLQS